MLENINNSMEYYCAYLRKSRKDAEAESHGQGETLARHQKKLEDYAASVGIKISKFYKEIVSGESIASRPVMQQLLTDVEAGLWTGVLVVEVERLARGNTLDQGIVSNAFTYSNTKIITPMKTYNPNDDYDQEYFEFGLFMSRREYKTINRRLQAGRNMSAKEGKYPGGHAPYGYKRKKLEGQKGFTLEIEPQEADIIRLIYTLYSQYTNPAEIAKRLDDMNIPPPRGNKWSEHTIRDILSNPVYIGKIRWGDRKLVKKVKDGRLYRSQPKNRGNMILVDGLHEAIIEESLFNQVQQVKSGRCFNPIPSIYRLKNPLSGIIVCGKCGKHITKVQEDLLSCTNRNCDNVSSKLSLVEKKLLEILEFYLKSHEQKIHDISIESDQEETMINNQKLKLEELNKELKEFSMQQDKICEFLEKGIYTTEMFTTRLQNIKQQIDTIQKKKLQLEDDIYHFQERKLSKQKIIPELKNILDNYNNYNVEEKNKLLKSVIDKVEYLKTEKCYGKNTNPEKFELKVYFKFEK